MIDATATAVHNPRWGGGGLAIVVRRRDDQLEQFSAVLELLELGVVEAAQPLCEDLDPPLAARLEHARSRGCGLDAHDPPVARIGEPPDEARGLELADDPGHRRRANPLGRCEVPQPDGAPEHDDRECRQARRRQTGGLVFAPEPSQQVNGGRVESVGQLDLARAWQGRRCARIPCVLRHPNSMLR
jgi:hypothetical protein